MEKLNNNEINSESINNLVGSNPFRILGIATNSSQKEIYKAANNIKNALRIGIQPNSVWNASWVSKLSITEANVQNSVGILQNPIDRLLEKLFWFSNYSNFLDSVNKENICDIFRSLSSTENSSNTDYILLGLIGLIIDDPDFKKTDDWSFIIYKWNDITENEIFWTKYIDDDNSFLFDKKSSYDMIELLKSGAISRICDSIIFLVESSNSDCSMVETFSKVANRTERILNALKKTEKSSQNSMLINEINSRILETIETQIGFLVTEMENKYGNLIIKVSQNTNRLEIHQNRIHCQNIENYYINPIIYSISKIQSCFTENQMFNISVNEGVCKILVNCAAMYTWGDDYNSSIRLLFKARQFSKMPLSLDNVENDISKYFETTVNKSFDDMFNEYGSKIIREEKIGNKIKKDNESYCIQMEELFIKPILNRYNDIQSKIKGTNNNLSLRELIVNVLMWLSSMYTWGDDYNSSNRLLIIARDFSIGLEIDVKVAQRIVDNNKSIGYYNFNKEYNKPLAKAIRGLKSIILSGKFLRVAIFIIAILIFSKLGNNSGNAPSTNTTNTTNSTENKNSSTNTGNDNTISQLKTEIDNGKVDIGSAEDELKTLEQSLNDQKGVIDNESNIDMKNTYIDEYNTSLSQYKEKYSQYDLLLNNQNSKIAEYNTLIK